MAGRGGAQGEIRATTVGMGVMCAGTALKRPVEKDARRRRLEVAYGN